MQETVKATAFFYMKYRKTVPLISLDKCPPSVHAKRNPNDQRQKMFIFWNKQMLIPRAINAGSPRFVSKNCCAPAGGNADLHVEGQNHVYPVYPTLEGRVAVEQIMDIIQR